MFSLIITIIAIVVVIALALATIYYGGDSFNKGNVQARSAALVIQGQQINGAADLYYTNYGYWPADLNALVTAGYLSSVPKGVAAADTDVPPSLLPEALATGLGWLTPVLNVPTYQVEVAVPDEICKAVNFTTLGSNGILAKIYAKYDAQCYFSATDKVNHVIVTRVPKTLGSVFPALDVASPTAAVPSASDTSGAWSTVPTKTSIIPTGPLSFTSDSIKVTVKDTKFFAVPYAAGTHYVFTIESLTGSPVAVQPSTTPSSNYPFDYSTTNYCNGGIARLICTTTLTFNGAASPSSNPGTVTFTPAVGGPVTINLNGQTVVNSMGFKLDGFSTNMWYIAQNACNELPLSYPPTSDSTSYYGPITGLSLTNGQCYGNRLLTYTSGPNVGLTTTFRVGGPVNTYVCYQGFDADGSPINRCQ